VRVYKGKVARVEPGVTPEATTPREAGGARPWLRWLAVVGFCAALLVAASLVAPSVDLGAMGAFVVGFCAVAGSALLTALAIPRVPPRLLLLVLVPLGVLAIAASLGGEPRLDVAVSVTAALLLGGSLVGACVGRAVEHPGQLLFVAVVSSAADIFSVFHPKGPSGAIAESEAALSLLALPWPLLGTGELAPFLGVGDVIFTALYVGAARKHGLSLPRTTLALALAYMLTMLAVLLLETVVPALPLLGLAMVLAHPEARLPAERDRVRGFVVMALVVTTVLALFWL
jgi:hypothetical protein